MACTQEFYLSRLLIKGRFPANVLRAALKAIQTRINLTDAGTHTLLVAAAVMMLYLLIIFLCLAALEEGFARLPQSTSVGAGRAAVDRSLQREILITISTQADIAIAEEKKQHAALPSLGAAEAAVGTEMETEAETDPEREAARIEAHNEIQVECWQSYLKAVCACVCACVLCICFFVARCDLVCLQCVDLAASSQAYLGLGSTALSPAVVTRVRLVVVDVVFFHVDAVLP